MMLLSFLEKHFQKHHKTIALPKKGITSSENCGVQEESSSNRRGEEAMVDGAAYGGGREGGRGAAEDGADAGGATEDGGTAAEDGSRRRYAKVSGEEASGRPQEDRRSEEAEAEMSQVRWTVCVILSTALVCYLLGLMGASLAWLLLFLIAMGAISHGHITSYVRGVVCRETQRKRIRSRAALCPLDETAEWLNFLLNRWWIFSSPSIFQVMKDRLEPLLNDAKPSIVESVELREFTLGQVTPEVTAVRGVYDACWSSYKSSQPSTPDYNGPYSPPEARRRRTYSGKASFGVSSPIGSVEGFKKGHLSFSSAGSSGAEAVSLDRFPVHRVALEADLSLDSDEFSMVLKTRLFGKDVGMDLDVAVEKLTVSGRVRATLTFDADTPFPHFSRLVLTFLNEPHVCFNIRILKSMQLMELPVLNQWINSVVMESLASSLVDPGHLTLKLASRSRSRRYHRRRQDRRNESDKPPCEEEVLNPKSADRRLSRGSSDGDVIGVLVAKLSIAAPELGNGVPSSGLDEQVWIVMTLEDQRKSTIPRLLSAHWRDSVSFLMCMRKAYQQTKDGCLTPNSQTGKVFTLKVKSRQGTQDESATTIATFEVPLDNNNPQFPQVIETTLRKRPGDGNAVVPSINLRLEYSPLPPVYQSDEFNGLNSPPASLKQILSVKPTAVGGVIFLWVHGAQDLCSIVDQSDCNPYCKIILNGKKVKTTYFVRGSANPKWNTRAQFLVSNYTRANFSFFLYSWNTKKWEGICDGTKMSKGPKGDGGSGEDGGAEKGTSTSSSCKMRRKLSQKSSSESCMLGVTSLCLVHHANIIWRRSFPLAGRSTPAGCAPATVTVSVIFCPINSVDNVAEKYTKRSKEHASISRTRASPSPYSTSTTASSSLSSSSAFSSFDDNEFDDSEKRSVQSAEEIPFYRGKRNSCHWIQQAKLLLKQRGKDNQDLDLSSCSEDLYSKAHNQALFELGIIKAHGLVAKDLNGYSDPYCEVRIDGRLRHRSSVRKKTLNPCWQETTIIELPTDQQTLQVDLWDHDVLGKHDFLGRVTLSAGEVRQACSIYKFSQVSEGSTEAEMTGYHQWYQLSDIKSGSIQLRFRPITDLNVSVSQGNLSVNSYSTARNVSPSPIMDRSAKSNRLLTCPLNVPKPPLPPPPPPCSPTMMRRPSNKFNTHRVAPPPPLRNHSSLQKLNGSSLNGSPPPMRTATIGSTMKMVKRLDESTGVPRVTVTESSSDKVGSRCSEDHQRSATPDPYFPKKSLEYSSFRVMKQKVKRGLNLRRFRSEANVRPERDEKKDAGTSPLNPAAPLRGSSVTLSIEPRGGGEADATELLNNDRQKGKGSSSSKGEGMRILGHAMSQPNLLLVRRHHAGLVTLATKSELPMTPSPSPSSSPSSSPQQPCRRPTDLNVVPTSAFTAPVKPDRYIGVEGRVIQAQGLNVARVAQLYCRVKLFRPTIPGSKSPYIATGKTLAKSRLLPSVPNPQFDLSFKVTESGMGGVGCRGGGKRRGVGEREGEEGGIPCGTALLFEIRSSGNKDTLASRRITLEELFSGAMPGTNEVHTWLTLSEYSSGASLEVELAHGRETKKAKGLFRSWSVHRIGKI